MKNIFDTYYTYGFLVFFLHRTGDRESLSHNHLLPEEIGERRISKYLDVVTHPGTNDRRSGLIEVSRRATG